MVIDIFTWMREPMQHSFVFQANGSAKPLNFSARLTFSHGIRLFS
jgi:hypothetical protein